VTPPPASSRTRTRRAFTAAELMIALALSAVVALAALGLLGTIYMSDSAAQKRFDSQAEVQTLQRAVRALARNITAKRAPDPVAGFGPEPGDAEISRAESELRAKMEATGQPFTTEGLRAQAIESARRTAREAASSAEDERNHIPPRFEVRFDASGSGGALPVLEALLTEAPVPPAWSPDPETRHWAMSANLVRGVIEGARSDDFEANGWTLQWRQTEPPAEPVALARRISGWEWSVLPRKKHDKDQAGFVETAAAWYGSDFPRALRLRILTMQGVSADWLFDIPRPIPEIADAADQIDAQTTPPDTDAPGTDTGAVPGTRDDSGFLPSPASGGGVPVRKSGNPASDSRTRIGGH